MSLGSPSLAPPQLDVSMRGAVSIARRLLDPLSELVKIDPRSIGVGLYQHDVDQKRLAGHHGLCQRRGRRSQHSLTCDPGTRCSDCVRGNLVTLLLLPCAGV